MTDTKKNSRLSIRLQAIADMVKPGSRIADIGTDHGYMPIELVKRGIARSAIAMDINRGPLESARTHVRAEKLTDRIELRLSDGLDALQKGEADTVMISGMGGGLIMDILRRGAEVLEGVDHLVLSPQSDIPAVRSFLPNIGYLLTDENMVLDEGKYYVILFATASGVTKETTAANAVRTTKEADTDTAAGAIKDLAIAEEKKSFMQNYCGPVLLQKKSPVFLKWLLRERDIHQKILQQLTKSADSDQNRQRFCQVQKELAALEQALTIMQEPDPVSQIDKIPDRKDTGEI